MGAYMKNEEKIKEEQYYNGKSMNTSCILKFDYKQYILLLALSILAIMTLFPVAIMILMSSKNFAEITASFWALPQQIEWGNYIFGLKVTAQYIVNSVIVSFFVIVLVLVINALAAHSISRIKFTWHKVFFYSILSFMMVPSILMTVPHYIVWRDLGVLNSYIGLIIPVVAGSIPGTLFFMKIFFDQLPKDLYDAASIDGAGELKILRHIVVPLSMPVFSLVTITTLLSTWNDYIWPYLIIKDPGLRTIPIALQFMKTEYFLDYQPGKLIAAYFIASLPMVIVFFAALKPFMKGMTSGAIKF